MTSRKSAVVLSQNLRSINTGFIKLRDSMEAEKVDCDVVCCQETFKVEGNYILEEIHRTTK